MNTLVPLESPCLDCLVSQVDLPTLTRGWALVDQQSPAIRAWIGERKSQLESIQQVATESIRVREELESLSEKIGQATDQLEQSAAAREDAERREKEEDVRFTERHGDLQVRLQAADGRLQDRQRMFSFKNPLYTEWGMTYGPHFLTVAVPALTYLHWDKLTENCSELSIQCASTFSEQSIYLPLGIAMLATVLFTRAAIEAKPLLKDVNELREKVRRCQNSYQNNKAELAREKTDADQQHKDGIKDLRSAKENQDQLTQRQEKAQNTMDSIRLQVLGDVYRRNVEQLREVFGQLEDDPTNVFAQKMGVKAMQNVTDLIVTAFSAIPLLTIEDGKPAHQQLKGNEH